MTFEKVKALLASQMGVDEDKITLDSDLVADFQADSLDIVQLLITMEREFGIVFEEEEMIKIRTVGDAVRFIDSHK